jgi:hypothetical protein
MNPLDRHWEDWQARHRPKPEPREASRPETVELAATVDHTLDETESPRRATRPPPITKK